MCLKKRTFKSIPSESLFFLSCALILCGNRSSTYDVYYRETNGFFSPPHPSVVTNRAYIQLLALVIHHLNLPDTDTHSTSTHTIASELGVCLHVIHVSNTYTHSFMLPLTERYIYINRDEPPNSNRTRCKCCCSYCNCAAVLCSCRRNE